MNKLIRTFAVGVAVVAFTLAFAGRVLAEEAKVFTLTIKNHQFEPALVEVPAGKKIILQIHNHDDSVEEFESHSLKREKIIPALGSVKIPVGPLKAGTYEFFGEFHEATAKGNLIAIE